MIKLSGPLLFVIIACCPGTFVTKVEYFPGDMLQSKAIAEKTEIFNINLVLNNFRPLLRHAMLGEKERNEKTCNATRTNFPLVLYNQAIN
jgi:hypothetical protein